MTDQAPAKTSRLSGWLKTIGCTLFGIVSGAFVMFLTPLVDNLVKPPKPLANFGIEHQGMTVTFVNRSTGATSGWWDFGDGTPLEPVDVKNSSITHTYPQPGSYTAKLSLTNIVNDVNERTVNVVIDGTAPVGPTIESLTAKPTSPESYAPVTFQISAKIKNADLCVYDFGTKQPMRIITDPANAPDQFVIFRSPGTHTIRLLAVAGKKTAELTQAVSVKPAARGMVSVVMTVTDQATQVDKLAVTETIGESFPANVSGSAVEIDRVLQARAGYTITDAKILPYNNPYAKNLILTVAADHASAHLTGELVRSVGPLGKKGPLTRLMVQVAMTLEQQSAASRAPIPLAATLTVPGTAAISLPPLPSNWINPKRAVQIQLMDGDKVLWSQPQLPQDAPVVLQNPPRTCKLTAAVAGDQIRFNLVDGRVAAGPTAN